MQLCRVTSCVVSGVLSSRASQRGIPLGHAASKGAWRRNARSASARLLGSSLWLQGSNSKLPRFTTKPMELHVFHVRFSRVALGFNPVASEVLTCG